ncbi:MAG: amidohydrolase family protein [Gammaproteobacteria bacterium]|nr:amidohydrolase family protein [Gammaproteobacteria bacterium]
MLLIRNAEIEGAPGLDVRCSGDGRIVEIGRGLQSADDGVVIDACGGAVLPGLHDHHIHLLALAAARSSVLCGPPEIGDAGSLRDALRDAPGDGWIRGVGYHESVAGMLNARVLDALVADRPVRVQHRSGKMWFLNSMAIRLVGAEAGSDGRLFRRDEWLRERLDADVDRAAVQATSRLLAARGVTGITDTTPSNDDRTARLLADLAPAQHVELMGSEALTAGTLKIMLDDYALPDIDALQRRIVTAHERGRRVAVHCVTRAELVFAASAFIETGSAPGDRRDRIEHASVTDDGAMALLRRAGLTVVTQPNLVFERGDQYLVDVDATDHGWLYRCRGFLDAGVPLGGGTDAPFGQPDPWAAMRAAVTRETAGGQRISEAREALTPEQALALFTTPPDDPGGAPRRVAVGAAADLCVLRCNWLAARERLCHDDVAVVTKDGTVTYQC